MESTSTDRDLILSKAGLFPLRFLGVGVYLAWLFTIHFSTSVFETSDRALDSLILSNFANLICLTLAALFARRIAPISTKKGFVWTAGASSFLGTVIASLAPLGAPAEALLFVIGNALVGAGTSLLILLWSELYASLPRRDASIFYSSSFVLAAVLFYAVSLLDSLWQMASIALLPVVSMVMFSLSVRLLPNQAEEVKESAQSHWTFPIRPSILLAVYAFASTLSRSMSFDSNDVGMLGMLLIAAVVLVCNVFLFDRFDARLLYKVTPPLMIAGFLLISFFTGFDGIGNILINAGFSGFVILTLIVLSNISYTYGVTAIWLFGLTRAFRVLASIAAAYGYSWATSLGFNDKAVLGACTIVLIATCAMFFLSDKDFTSTWGINPLPAKKSDTVEEFFETLQGKCSIIAHRFGLTQREEEVLVLLAQDKSIAEVEEALFISNGTAKSHIRHIYAKLDVHAREEIVEMVREL
ncbi:response regulator transcription factor [Raoultibacter phocaeensis]|uniref:response regulator transcription factor n=1 Tax=Raoultibacter phocaeensis TaxID=2479841 RepID=UPI001117D5AA|nr:helix-turn-helix transcriptional regulator [Raoultibacter phocaeensis]